MDLRGLTPSPTPPPALPLAPRMENAVAESKSVMTGLWTDPTIVPEPRAAVAYF
nr:hypothetical protein JVH1_0004 [Rhodococcus sp. JVH1]